MYQKLYERIVKRCEEMGWSIAKTEREADVANGIIGKMKNGEGITVVTIVKIAKSLGVSVDYLLGISEEQ
jgi:transcriptional regulator with XRE-family HTH domain